MNKIKYLFSICFVAVFVFCMSVGVKAEETEIDTSVFEYEENEDGTINVTRCNENEETVIIPSEIDGKKVKNIKLNRDNSRSGSFCKIKNLIISEGIINIMQYSFGRCNNLETVSLPSTIQTIGKDAFGDCKKLKSINLPEGLTSIGESAFDDCYSLENIILPNSLISLGEFAFRSCDSLSKVIVPGNLKVIEKLTFYSCDKLQEVEIKEGVTKIGNSVFTYCINLQKIIIPNSVSDIHDCAFGFGIGGKEGFPSELIIYADPNSYARTYANKNGIIFSCLNTHDWDNGVITGNASKTNKSYTCIYTCSACGIKNSKIFNSADLPKKGKVISTSDSKEYYKIVKSGIKNGTVEFVKMKNLKNDITVPDTVTVDGITYKIISISKNAFKNNNNLKKITIGSNITKIGVGAFKGCKNLKTITIKSKNLKSVGKNAFKGINPKAKIKVPSSCLEKYKKLLAKKGQKSSVKITK